MPLCLDIALVVISSFSNSTKASPDSTFKSACSYGLYCQLSRTCSTVKFVPQCRSTNDSERVKERRNVLFCRCPRHASHFDHESSAAECQLGSIPKKRRNLRTLHPCQELQCSSLVELSQSSEVPQRMDCVGPLRALVEQSWARHQRAFAEAPL